MWPTWEPIQRLTPLLDQLGCDSFLALWLNATWLLGALFSKVAQALWVREERRHKRPSPPNWEFSKLALAKLARSIIEGAEADDLLVVRAVEKLESEELFRAALDANLLVQNGDFVRFYHDLLRSYFAAEALAEADVATFYGWCRDHPLHWRSVAIAWSGICSRADEFLKQIHWQDSAELVGGGYVASEEAIRHHMRRAMEELAIDHWRSFEPAMDALTRMGRAVAPLLVEELRSSDAEMRARRLSCWVKYCTKAASEPKVVQYSTI